jgi:hypothetical protein
VRSYWGEATLVVGDESFEIRCALDERQVEPGAPIRGWITRVSELRSWGGYFALLDPSREEAFHAALAENASARLRVPDGRQATVSVHGDLIQSADGDWLA